MTLPTIRDPDRIALFLDFDGTLVEIAPHPDAVHLEDETRETLAKLEKQLGGAVALITGREIQVVDRFMEPLRLPVAGVHGLRRRDAEGNLHGLNLDTGFVAKVTEKLEPFVGRHKGLFLEHKDVAVALHYRARPELGDRCVAMMDTAIRGVDGALISRGKMVIEARSSAGGKRSALSSFMAEAPFAGRIPVFAGDDITDEEGFEYVNELGGTSIKVGGGPTKARTRALDTQDFLTWLKDLSARFDEGLTAGAPQT